MKLAIISVLLLVVFLGQRSVSVEGVQQELRLYLGDESEGAALFFDKSQTNLTRFKDILPLAKSYCSRGFWQLFGSENYWDQYSALGNTNTDGLHCSKFETYQDPSKLRSVRHWAANDMSVDAVSLYSGDWFQGEELLITDTVAYAGIKTPIKSLSASGKTDWTIFEGQRLDGKSACISVPKNTGNFFNYYGRIEGGIDTWQWNMTTVGSLYTGCDLLAIQEYKETHDLM